MERTLKNKIKYLYLYPFLIQIYFTQETLIVLPSNKYRMYTLQCCADKRIDLRFNAHTYTPIPKMSYTKKLFCTLQSKHRRPKK